MIEKIVERADAGLRFYAIRTDKFKMSRLSFNFILPADREKSPLTRLMLAVMMRGCNKYPTVVDINRKLDELYGATVTWRASSVGERHVFRISCEMLSNQYRFSGDDESVVRGVCDVVLNILLAPLRDEQGLLSSAHFESERKLAIDAIRAKINDQRAYAAEQCRELMLRDEPAGIPIDGTEEQIADFTLQDVSENLDYFLKNAILECFYVGNDNVEDVISLIGDRFAAVGREHRDLPGKEKALIRPADFTVRTAEEVMNVAQSRLNIGCTCGTVMSDRDYYAMSLFNEIFGGSSVGKLFINVRERKSLCYYCYSSYGSATGTLAIGCGIKNENKDAAYSEIEKQLREMQCGHFDDSDVETAKRTVISGVRQMSDSPSAIEAFRFRRILAGVEETAEECVERIMSVTKEEIIAAARGVKIDTVYFLSGDGEEEALDDE